MNEGVEYLFVLTGTPMPNRPKELISPLKFLRRLDELGGFWKFVNRYCDGHQGEWGYNMDGSSNLIELHKKLSPFFLRRLKEEVLKDLPPKTYANVPLDINNRKEYTFAEKELIEWFGNKAEKVAEENYLNLMQEMAEEENLDMPLEEFKRLEGYKARRRAEAAEVLIRINSLKKLTAEGKLNNAIKWIEDFISSGEKLVVFAHHREIVQKIADYFGAPTIMGGQSAKSVQEGKERFQNDEDCKIIVCNLAAGGVGHTLTAASNLAFVEYGWNPATMDQAADRIHRIGQEKKVTIWNLLAHDTMDETLNAIIARKRKVVDAAIDGKVDGAKQESVIGDFIKELIA